MMNDKEPCSCSTRSQGYFTGEWDFDNFQNYLNHTQQFQEISVEKIPNNIEKEKRQYQCKHCGRIYLIITPRDPYCECSKVKEQRDYNGLKDFYFYKNYVNESKLFQSIPVRKSAYGGGLEEKWYECLKCKKIYRLIEPDSPFGGTWELVGS